MSGYCFGDCCSARSGSVFFLYGKKQRAVVPLVCGLVLMIYPYFIPNVMRWSRSEVGAHRGFRISSSREKVCEAANSNNFVAPELWVYTPVRAFFAVCCLAVCCLAVSRRSSQGEGHVRID